MNNGFIVVARRVNCTLKLNTFYCVHFDACLCGRAERNDGETNHMDVVDRM